MTADMRTLSKCYRLKIHHTNRAYIKGALDKYNIIPQLFQKKKKKKRKERKKKSQDFYTISVSMGNDCMLSVTF